MPSLAALTPFAAQKSDRLATLHARCIRLRPSFASTTSSSSTSSVVLPPYPPLLPRHPAHKPRWTSRPRPLTPALIGIGMTRGVIGQDKVSGQGPNEGFIYKVTGFTNHDNPEACGAVANTTKGR